MLKKKIVRISWFSSLFILLFLFQNCSEVGFETLKFDPTNTYDGKIDFNDDTDLHNLPGMSPGEDVAVELELTEKETLELLADLDMSLPECHKNLNHEAVDYLGKNLSLQNVIGHAHFANIGQLNLSSMEGIQKFSQVGYAASVNFLRGINIIEANFSNELSELKGISCIATNGLNTASGLRGVSVFYGSQSGLASYESISNVRGAIYLKNVSLENLSNFRGVLILENSSVANYSQVNVLIKDLNKKESIKVNNTSTF